jgi:hypothetical protein
MGGSISWNNSQKKLTILYNGKTVELWIGSNKVCVNGIDKEMDVVPYVSDKGRTMLPLRFVAENLGCVISWDNSTLTARIVYEKVNEGTAAAPSTTETAIPPEAATPPANANTTNSQTGTMSWTGVWDSLYGTMILTQSGNKVTGTYESDDYILEGTVNGNTLSGTYNEDGDIGHFEFVLIGDGTFSGRHRYEGDQEWSEWSGRSISASHGSTGTAWGGVWYTDYGPMIVTQSGFSFSGVYKGAGLYRIEGTISGTTVKGKIFEGESHGEFQFTLLGDGKGFVGKWRYDGEAEWTDWTGIKKK